MYYYYFNVDHGRSDTILVARVIETRKARFGDYPCCARLDGNSELVRYWTKNYTKKFKEKYTREGMWKSIVEQEGIIRKRQFWLDGDLNMDRARQIIVNYKVERIEELQARLQRMEES